MLLEDWQKLQQILVIQSGPSHAIERLGVPMEHLKQCVPQADIAFLCASSASPIALSLPGVTQVIVHQALTEQGLTGDAVKTLDLIEMLQTEELEAAIIFSHQNASPYPMGYVCYLAGIPIRVGISQEFGGGVLSHCVKPEATIDANLLLLKTVGLMAEAEVK